MEIKNCKTCSKSKKIYARHLDCWTCRINKKGKKECKKCKRLRCLLAKSLCSTCYQKEKGYVYKGATHWTKLKRKVGEINGWKCYFCNEDRKEMLDAHHIIPKSDGGKNMIDNLILICPNHHREVHLKIKKI